MLVTSHSIIGKTIHDYIFNSLGVKLSLSDLRYGCMLPDFHPKFISIPHYKSKSFETVSQMILSIQKSSFSGLPKHISRFSTDLGIILHFITDYFCYPHNNIQADRMPYHIIYEINLEKELRKYISNRFRISNFNLEVEACMNFNTNLMDFIQIKHKQYMNEAPGPLNDVVYGLQCCCVIAAMITNGVVLKSTKEVA